VGDTVTAHTKRYGLVHGKVTHVYPTNGLTIVQDPKHGEVAVSSGDIGTSSRPGRSRRNPRPP